MASTTDTDAVPETPAPPARLRVRYREEIAPTLADRFGRTNPMSWPRLEKVVLNVNMGRHLENNKLPANVKDQVTATLTTVSGQKPVIVIARKSVSNFKVREGAETAAMVTLRGDRAWHFLDRLINLVTPRIKDFRGLSEKAFDAKGNYSMGLTEQAVFPEIDMGKVGITHGMHVNLVFRNSTPEISRYVLGELGFPFARKD
ncbi:MAG: 50S ribosomal protein L5 [Planctomycetota bacterium]|nr:MAG: 50S ribosomal protein L5 [Planctomycetota bacterium]